MGSWVVHAIAHITISTVDEMLFISALDSLNKLDSPCLWPGEGSDDQGPTGSNVLGPTLVDFGVLGHDPKSVGQPAASESLPKISPNWQRHAPWRAPPPPSSPLLNHAPGDHIPVTSSLTHSLKPNINPPTPPSHHSPTTMSSKLGDLPDELQLATAQHVKYIQSLDTRRDEYDYWLTEHLRLNGVYWGLVALHLLGRPDALPRAGTIDFVLSCQHDSGGFGAAPGHDAHMLYTVSAVQILAMVDAFDELEERGKEGGKAKVGECECCPTTDPPSPPQDPKLQPSRWLTTFPLHSHSRPAEPPDGHLCRRRVGRGGHPLPLRRLQRPLPAGAYAPSRRGQGREPHRRLRQL